MRGRRGGETRLGDQSSSTVPRVVAVAADHWEECQRMRGRNPTAALIDVYRHSRAHHNNNERIGRRGRATARRRPRWNRVERPRGAPRGCDWLLGPPYSCGATRRHTAPRRDHQPRRRPASDTPGFCSPPRPASCKLRRRGRERPARRPFLRAIGVKGNRGHLPLCRSRGPQGH